MPSSSSKPRLAIYVALAVAVLLIGARFLRESGGGSGASASTSAGFATSPSTSTSTPDGRGAGGAPAGAGGALDAASIAAGGPRLVVDVKGAVRHPGVYRLAAGSRTYDAVRRAGGLTRRADRVGVNLAARVVDGGEVVVPVRGASAGGAATTVGSSGGAGAGAAAGRPLALDLDTATEQELEQLDGVGPAIAAKIVAYREQHGGFRSIDELDQVSGIGDAKLAAIRAQLGR
jgi:competence protein ComEA